MAGIYEKGNTAGLFEREIEFKGKYATMARYLRDEIGLFPTFREVYVISIIFGYLYGKGETEDSTEKVQAASIFPTELVKKKTELKLLYRLIMLLKEEPGFTIDDYKDRAFRDDPEVYQDNIISNTAIINDFACGGVEYIYNCFADLHRQSEIVDKLYELVHAFIVDVGLSEDSDELPDFSPSFE